MKCLLILNFILSSVTQGQWLKEIPIVSPAGPVDAKVFKALQKTFPQLRNVSWAPGVYWHSASDEDRAIQLLKVLTGDFFWIWCLRGGYGSARLVPSLREALVKGYLSVPKVFIGYSDITCLHLWAHTQGWKGIHGVMPADWEKPWVQRTNFTLLEKILSQKKGVLHYAGMEPLNEAAKHAKLLKGEIIGGNLTLLIASIGTSWQLKSQQKIIIMEDLNVEGYQIDRSLYHLVEANILQGATALIFGTFSGKNSRWKNALTRFSQRTSIPVFYWPYFGHGVWNYPIPLGFESRLEYTMGHWNWYIPYDFSH